MSDVDFIRLTACKRQNQTRQSSVLITRSIIPGKQSVRRNESSMTANYDDGSISVSALDAPHVHKIYSDRTIYFPHCARCGAYDITYGRTDEANQRLLFPRELLTYRTETH